MTRIHARYTTVLAAVAVALSGTACKDKLLGIAPAISVTPDHLGFGQGMVGQRQQLRVSVANNGSAPLQVTSIKVSSDPNGELAVWELLATDCGDLARSGGNTLAPGECARFSVTWTPAAAHAAAGAVEIDSNDTTNGVITLPVTGTAVSPLLQYCILDSTGAVVASACSNLGAMPASIPAIDFGAGTLGAAATRVVRVTNKGQAALLFAPAPSLSATSSNDFALSGSVPNNKLAAGASADLTITATPTTTGAIAGALLLSSNDVFVPRLSVPITTQVAAVPSISVSPSTLAFGTGQVGQALQIVVSATNVGTAPLLVTAVKVATDPNSELKVASILSNDCAGNPRSGGSTLAPAECAQFLVVWTPGAVHAAAGSVEVDSDDAAHPVVTLPVTGDAVAAPPIIQVTPASIAFGSTTPGTALQQAVSVKNIGTGPLVIASGGIKVSSNPNGDLSVGALLTTDCAGAARSGGNTLQPGECARFNAIWTPAVPGVASGTLEVDSNDASNPAVQIPVSGGTSTAPLLQVCVLSSAGAVVQSQCTNLAATPHTLPSLNFGTLQPGTSASNVVRLFNLGNAQLTLSPAPSVSNAGAAVFSLSGSVAGNSIAAGATADLTINATASASGTLGGTFNVVSNDARATTVQIPISMTVPTWNVCASSTSLAFGAINIGTTASNTVSLTNCGQTSLKVNSMSYSGASQFTVTNIPAAGVTIAANAVVTLNVAYKPTAVQSDSGSIAYSLAAASATVTGSIGLSGSGVLASCGSPGRNPVANAAAYYTTDQSGATSPSPGYTLFVPAATTATSTPVLPLDYVKLDASGSTAAQGTGALTYAWTLTSQPLGSQTALTATTGAVTSLQTLVSEKYVVTLVVKDATNCASAANNVIFYVLPQGSIHIELVWDTSCGDLDLHYVPPGGTMCDGDDLFYADLPNSPNAYPPGYDGPGFPDWGCADSSCFGQPTANVGGPERDYNNTDDATLDHDAVHGKGPENVTQKAPFNASASNPYQVWVYYYGDNGYGSSSCGTINPAVYFYVDGQPYLLNIGGQLSNGISVVGGMTNHYAWHVADISVAGPTNVSITPKSGTNFYPDDWFRCGPEVPSAYGYDAIRSGARKLKVNESDNARGSTDSLLRESSREVRAR